MHQKAKSFVTDESGAVVLVMTLLLVAFLGIGALGIDYGYMSVVQNDLKNAAEAGALAGAKALGSAENPDWSSGESAAEAIVGKNSAAGQLLTDCQVENGYWDVSTKSFVADPAKILSSGQFRAIRVVVARSPNNNGGALQLSFAPLLGINTTDVTGAAVAITTATSVTGGWGILQIGNGDVSISGAVANKGSVGVNGNGNVSLSGSGSIDGNLYVNGNGDVSLPGATVVRGSVWDKGSGKFTMKGSASVVGVAYLDNDVTQSYAWSTSINGHQYQGGDGFQPGDITSDASGASAAQTAAQQAQTTYNDYSTRQATDPTTKVNLSGTKTLTINGTQAVNVVNLSTLKLAGSTTLYLNAPANESFVINVSGTFSVGGTGAIVLQGGLKYENVTFVNTGTGTVTLGGSGQINGNILSPNGPITYSGGATYSGTLVSGQKITLAGSVNSPVTIPWLTSPSGSSSVARAYLVQ